MKMLIKEIGNLTIDQGPPNIWTIDPAQSDEGWTTTPAGFIYNEQIIDLAGLSQQEKTLFFGAITQQDWTNPVATNGQVAGDKLQMTDIITTVPMNELTLEEVAFTGNFAVARGFGRNKPTFEQTIYFRHGQFVIDIDNAASSVMLPTSINQLGSGAPTASDRLYCYRIVAPYTPTTAQRIFTTPVRYVVGVDPREEKEYQYLMRLKKSYDLQQSFDVDGNRPH